MAATFEPLDRPQTIGVHFTKTVGLTVTNTDQGRPSYLDVFRAGDQGRRQVIEPGQVFECQIAPGQADITLGPALGCHFVDLDEL